MSKFKTNLLRERRAVLPLAYTKNSNQWVHLPRIVFDALCHSASSSTRLSIPHSLQLETATTLPTTVVNLIWICYQASWFWHLPSIRLCPTYHSTNRARPATATRADSIRGLRCTRFIFIVTAEVVFLHFNSFHVRFRCWTLCNFTSSSIVPVVLLFRV